MAIITNRNGTKIHIWKDSMGLHVNGHAAFARVSGDGEGWTLWDPPGGPCIVTGMRLEELHDDFKGLIAGRIRREEGGILVECTSL